MKGILSVLIVAVTTTSTAFGGDPVQWKQADGGNGHWYQIIYTDGTNWNEDRQAAIDMDGDLATITSQAENDFITSLYTDSNCHYWTSLGGLKNGDGVWEWISGEDWIFENWHPGEPNGDGNALNFHASGGCNGTWNDVNPNTQQASSESAFVVEWTVVQPMQWKLEDGGNGHWYEAVSVPEGLTWLQAKAEAEARGGYLATLTSEAEDQFVAFTIADSDTVWNFDGGVTRGPYFGGQRTEDETGGCDLNTMQWVTGEPWGYTRWHSGNPNEDCTSGIQFWGYAQRTWQDQVDDDATRANGYIIEYTMLPGTPLGGCCLGGFHCLTSTNPIALHATVYGLAQIHHVN